MLLPNIDKPFISHMIGQPECYILSDGRIWSVAKAMFIASVPEGAFSDTCGDGTVKALLHMLRWNRYPLGELATDDDLAKEAREKRNALIAETDYMAMPDYPLGDAKKAAVLAYRQALRDVPAQAGFPRRIVWPVKP